MAYEYGYMSGYNPYTPAITPAGYPGAPTMTQRPYIGAYGATSGVPQNTGMQTAQLPPAQTQQSNVPWIQVPNIEAARNVMVQPNQTAYMMNQNAPEFYVKSTDQMGVATLRCFAFQEFNPTEQAAKEVLSAQADKLVSREEFTQFAQAVNAQFNALQQGVAQTTANTMTAPTAPMQTPAPTVPLVPTQQETAPKKKDSTK